MLEGIMNILLQVIFLALFIFGLIQCRRHFFTAGFYFFLILIINKISFFIYSRLIGKYIDSLAVSDTLPPFGMTIGELLSWIILLPRFVEIIAFSFLVVGLYRMRNPDRKII